MNPIKGLAAYCLLAAVCFLSGCSSTSTQPIVDVTGQPVAGSVATLEPVVLGGVKQWILIRGRSASSPLVLKLHGGPGQAEMATVPFNRLLEQDFLVVEWDQREAGKSGGVPVAELSMEQIVSDTVELSQHLLRRFNQDRLILVGHSWGSAVGLQAVQRAPQMYRAFVSTGQMTNFSNATAAGYRGLTEHASRTGDTSLTAVLKALGQPPYVGAEGQHKRARYFEQSAHFPQWEEPGGFHELLRRVLRESENTQR